VLAVRLPSYVELIVDWIIAVNLADVAYLAYHVYEEPVKLGWPPCSFSF
jgi:hypothetical protein